MAFSAFGTMAGTTVAHAEGGCELGFTAHDGGDFLCDPGLTASDETTSFTRVEGKLLNHSLGSFNDGDESALAADFVETGHVSTIQWDTGGPITDLTAADFVKTGSGDEGSSWNVVKEHVYDEGVHNGTIVVHDVQPLIIISPDSKTTPKTVSLDTVTLHFTITVTDALLCNGASTNLSATEGQAFTDQQIGTFIDNNHLATADDFTVTINWGDGHTSTGTAVKSNVVPDVLCEAIVLARPATTLVDPTQWNVIGSHTYAEEGTFPISFHVVDNTNTTNGAGGNATVADAALGSSCIANLSTPVNSAFNGAVVNFTDADPLGANADYSATINWGDGTGDFPGTITGSGPGGGVSGSHTYTKAGSYQVTVKIADIGGSKTQSVCAPAQNFGVQVLAAAVVLPKAGSGPLNSLPMGALLLAVAMAIGTVGSYELLMGRGLRAER